MNKIEKPGDRVWVDGEGSEAFMRWDIFGPIEDFDESLLS